jgi:hypothetical protein
MDNRIDKHLERIETKVDRIDTKLDVLGNRTTTTETDIVWVKGGLAIGLTIILAVAGFITSVLAKSLFN